jgi:hypothetical protein
MKVAALLTVHNSDIDTPARRRQLLRWLDANREALRNPNAVGPILISHFRVPHKIPLRSARAEKY